MTKKTFNAEGDISQIRYENYPWWIIAITIIFQLAIYIIGGLIIVRFGLIWLIIYLIYVAILEITFYPKSCVYCFYYGKWCAFGKGKIASWLFKKKNPSYFCKREASIAKMLPEMLVIIVPVILGIVLLIKHFEICLLTWIILDLILVSFGNGWVRGKLTCPYCKQSQICCPALAMFKKMK